MVAQPPINSPAVSTTTRNNLPDSVDLVTDSDMSSTNISGETIRGGGLGEELEKSSSGSSPSATTTTTMSNSHHNHHYQSSHHHHHYSQHYVSKRDRQIATSTSKTNLYIKGLKEETTDKDLYDMCAK